MPQDYGKPFEIKTRECLSASFPQGYLYRLPDQMSYFKGSGNPCDILCYVEGHLFLIETKSLHGNTFNLNFAQKERLKSIHVEGVHPLLVTWFVTHNKVLAFPITSVEQMEKDGLKSIHIDTYMNYPHIDVPSVKKRVFMDSDYKCLLEYYKKLDVEVK